MDDNTIRKELLDAGMQYEPKKEQFEVIKYLLEGNSKTWMLFLSLCMPE